MMTASLMDEVLAPPTVAEMSEKVTEPKLASPVVESWKVTSSRIHSAAVPHSASDDVTVLVNFLPLVLFSRTTDALVVLAAVSSTFMTWKWKLLAP